MLEINKIHQGDSLSVLKTLDGDSIDCCITSPPYWGLRDYGADGQLGLEKTPQEYVDKMVEIFNEVKRVLKPQGTLWLNIGDSYCGSNSDSNSIVNKSTISASMGQGLSYPDKSVKSRIIGLKPKDLVGIPWMTAFALRSSGWWLRQDIIWAKPNPMPESVTDRCTKSHEYIFLMSKSQKYYFDYEAIQEEANYDGRNDTVMKGSDKYSDGEYLANGNANSLSVKGRERWKFKNLSEKVQINHSFHESRADGIPDEQYAVRNKRDVWTVNTKPFKEAHFATFPEKLIVDMIKAGCPEGGVVLDPFMGSGTTGLVARKLDRNYIGIELNPKYIKIAEKRIREEMGLFF